MVTQRLPAKYRIRRDADFKRAYRRRVRASDQCLLVYGCENGYCHPRLGLAVSRKLGGAVIRNRWKRRLREAFRLSRERLPAGIDLVAIPRWAEEPEFAELTRSLCTLANRVASNLAKDQP